MANKMHLVGCRIQVGGDIGTVVVRDETNPFPWPEIAVLKHLHGEDNVHTFTVVDTVDAPTPYTEKSRLLAKYGYAVNDVYPGNNPNIEWTMPGVDVEADEPPKRRRVAAGVEVE